MNGVLIEGHFEHPGLSGLTAINTIWNFDWVKPELRGSHVRISASRLKWVLFAAIKPDMCTIKRIVLNLEQLYDVIAEFILLNTFIRKWY